MPNIVPRPTQRSANTDGQRRANRQLIAAVLRIGSLSLPTDCPDLSPLLARIDALTSADQPAA